MRHRPKRSKARKDSRIKPEHRLQTPPVASPGSPTPLPTVETSGVLGNRGIRLRLWTILTVVALLSLHYILAARSLLQENPTVDEVVHLPAGVTYWQKGTFRLYHHNPPLAKLVAALPVIWARPDDGPSLSDIELEVERPFASRRSRSLSRTSTQFATSSCFSSLAS